MLYDGSEIFYIESASLKNSSNSLNNMHVVYKHSNLKSNFSCGTIFDVYIYLYLERVFIRRCVYCFRRERPHNRPRSYELCKPKGKFAVYFYWSVLSNIREATGLYFEEEAR